MRDVYPRRSILDRQIDRATRARRQKKRPPCGGPFQWLPDDQAAATAALFLIFLRRAKNPSRPAPPANSGSVAGMGVAPVDWP